MSSSSSLDSTSCTSPASSCSSSVDLASLRTHVRLRTRVRAKPGRLRILIDLIHAPENNPDDYNLNKCDYEYYNSYSWFRLFEILVKKTDRYEWTCVRNGKLVYELLHDYDLLFINLIHEERPHFLPEEISSIQQWVDEGGGMFVVGEHTNAYHSAEKINPLLRIFGLEMGWCSALDTPEFCTEAPGWLLVRHMERTHPITQQVDTLHMKAAGTINFVPSNERDSEGVFPCTRVVATLSENGWADKAGNEPPAFFGDGVYTEGVDEKGKKAVCATSEFGLGRVFLVSDQNMHGDAWLHFRHNFRIAANAIDWLSEVNFLPPITATTLTSSSFLLPFSSFTPLRDVNIGFTIGVDTRFRPYSIAKKAKDDYFAWFCNLNREHSISARAVSVGTKELSLLSVKGKRNNKHRKKTNNREKESTMGKDSSDREKKKKVNIEYDDDRSDLLDVLIFPSPTEPVSLEEIAFLTRMCSEGKIIVLLMNVLTASKHAFELLYELAPTFSFSLNGTKYELLNFVRQNEEKLASFQAKNRERKHLISREAARLEGGGEKHCGEETDDSKPFLDTRHLLFQDISFANVQSEWGSSFLRTNIFTFDAALGCLCSQSSESPDKQKFLASHATDGNPQTCTHTAWEDEYAWIEVDLEKEIFIHTISILNRVDAAQSRLQDIFVTLFTEEKREEVWKSETLNVENELNSPTHLTVIVGSEDQKIKARYVRVLRKPNPRLDKDHRNVLSVGSIQVITSVDQKNLVMPLFNAAQLPGCMATQSSQSGDNPADRALDGQWDTFSHTHADDAEAWWQVDLQQQMDVRMVNLINRQDGWEWRFQDLVVTLLDENSRVIYHSEPLNPQNRNQNLAQLNHVIPIRPCIARFVKVRRIARSNDEKSSEDRNVLCLVEVQVMAVARQPSDLGFRMKVDIARVGRIGQSGGHTRRKENNEAQTEGSLVVFLQDQFWRNDVLNIMIDRRPRVAGEFATRLQYSLLDWFQRSRFRPK